MLVAVVSVLGPTGAAAQAGDEWAEVVRNAARLGAGVAAFSDANIEVDFEVGDMDRDGWPDVVLVREPLGSSTGFHTNALLMNRDGVLVDESATYASASASDVAGDLGFLTPTNDRDLAVCDLTGDGWLDAVTATTLSDGEAKAISHPRVYVNLGEDGAGNWLGLLHEEARIPQPLDDVSVGRLVGRCRAPGDALCSFKSAEDTP